MEDPGLLGYPDFASNIAQATAVGSNYGIARQVSVTGLKASVGIPVSTLADSVETSCYTGLER
jgi:hypothetical protein